MCLDMHYHSMYTLTNKKVDLWKVEVIYHHLGVVGEAGQTEVKQGYEANGIINMI